MDFPLFFHTATGHDPFPYQRRLAEGDWPDRLDVPTGMGKTAAVVLAWLWRRHISPAATPRRLVFCLPMRVLVRQTEAATDAWLANLQPYLRDAPAVRLLMGGDVDKDWDRFPDRPAILVGTQDMLLSRALNRGYAQSRYRWPLNFGLLNNDCLWIFDETQLMGVGVQTSAQLQGLRRRLGTLLPTRSLWMSATMADSQIDTVDHPRPPEGWTTHALTDPDLQHPTVLRRVHAAKHLHRSELQLTKANAKSDYARQLAAAILQVHRPGTLTLAVVNRVQRAQEVAQHLRKLRPQPTVTLLHARFLPTDRHAAEASLGDAGDRIIVSTQVVEAGVDLSAQTLVTELAPWTSLVQRFGRCNRQGLQDGASVHWIDCAADAETLPYEPADLDAARTALLQLESAAIRSVQPVRVPERSDVPAVLRHRDLVDLFDTTPDLSGSDVDVSGFIREDDDNDVHVYWRALSDEEPDPKMAAPARDELCPVPVGAFNAFRKSNPDDVWTWNGLEGRYVKPAHVRPGQTFVVAARAGGYSPEWGWLGTKSRAPVPPVPSADVPAQPMDGDPATCIGRWVTLDEHLRDVAEESGRLAAALGLPADLQRALTTSGRWHDAGKAHCAFQNALDHSPGLWAKSENPTHRLTYEDDEKNPRRGFRHELASALAWLQHAESDPQRDLIAYLIAAHHGKVRLSIRSMPNETPPESVKLFARGVWDGDTLPPVDGLIASPVTLHLSLMQMGRGSWLERTTTLRDAWGPFRLALLESLVRVADWRASERESEVVLH